MPLSTGIETFPNGFEQNLSPDRESSAALHYNCFKNAKRNGAWWKLSFGQLVLSFDDDLQASRLGLPDTSLANGAPGAWLKHSCSELQPICRLPGIG